MITHFRLLIAIAIGLVMFSLQNGRAESGATLDGYLKQLGYESVPFRANEKHQPLVECELGGHKHTLLADTGCGLTILDESVARGLKNLQQLGVALEDPVYGTLTNSTIVLIEDLKIGRAKFVNQPAEPTKVEADYLQVSFEGALGQDFFRRNSCIIDCGARRLYLHGAQPSEEARQALQATLKKSGFVDVPLNLETMPAVNTAVNHEPVEMLVDTGSAVSCVDQSVANRLQLKPRKSDAPATGTLIPEPARGNVIGLGKIGLHRAWVTTLSSLQVGPKEWKNVTYGVEDLKAWNLSKPGTRMEKIEGIFGNEWLERYGVLIDFVNAKVWFRPQK